ncbi:HD-GYP domain-containing protein [Thiofilum flexile]|uniref:HD-GYP domain-containing protein n=1 Tax=Thiofilum flexile TaxID=125627 RepID=UPI000372EB9E|nr:HD domain-containing phosphohydrolase [Thiofilum flexile]
MTTVVSKVLPALYSALDMVIFVRQPCGLFQAVSDLPAWSQFWLKLAQPSQSQEQNYALTEAFSYLSYFMPDAEEHWKQSALAPLRSGPWIEIDELHQELVLEAGAVWVEDKPVLFIQRMGSEYYQEVERLQLMRNGLLVREELELEVQRRTLKIKQREEEIAIKLVSLTSFRDEETGAHVRRIGLYAAAMAKALNWSQERIDDIRVAAPMHDIGKIGVPDRILLKAGKLTEAEFSIMKRHTEIGAKMLEHSHIPTLDMAADIALCHHERWDGSGYPMGLAGEDIPITARITTIVDVYDALVHERVYKLALSEEETIALMLEQRGKHFDPYLLDIFLGLLPVMRRIRYQVQEIDDLIVRAD